MTDNIDDDEALFDDIYEDDAKAGEDKKGKEDISKGKDVAKPAAVPPTTEPAANVAKPEAETKPSTTTTTTTSPLDAVKQLSQLAGQSQGPAYDQSNQAMNPQMNPQMPPFPAPPPGGMQQFPPQMGANQQGANQMGGQPGGRPGAFHDKVKADLAGKDVGKLFIGGLTWETDEESLGNYFGQFGEVTELHIMRDTATGRSRGFAFLTFADPASVDKVLQKKHILDGKLIDPKRAIPKEEQEKTGKIFVGGIAPDVTHQEFTDYFKQFGSIIDSQLMIDKDTGKSRGYGFVTYDSAQAVDRVTRQKYVMFHGRQMEIKKAEPRNQQTRARQTNYGPYSNVGGVAGQPMMNPYMNNGFYGQNHMAQYWQQMQQMQQYWMQMQRMQQQQQGEGESGEETPGGSTPAMPAMIPSGPAQGSGDDNSPPGDHGSRAGSQPRQSAEDEVPNPQERSMPHLPSGPKGFHGGSRRGRGSRGPHRHRGGSRGGRRANGGYHPYRR